MTAATLAPQRTTKPSAARARWELCTETLYFAIGPYTPAISTTISVPYTSATTAIEPARMTWDKLQAGGFHMISARP